MLGFDEHGNFHDDFMHRRPKGVQVSKSGQKQCENPDFNAPFYENDSKTGYLGGLGSKITNFLTFKDQIDSIARSLERIAEVLERGVPPAQIDSPLPRLTEKDFSRSSNDVTFEQEVLDAVLLLNPDMAHDPEALGRVREFIHHRSQL